VAEAATGDVVEDHPVADTEAPATGADLDDPAARLVAGDHVLVCLRPVAEVLAVDGADVAATDRRRLHVDQDLAVAGRRSWHVVEGDLPSAGETYAAHCCACSCYAFINEGSLHHH
jgi:hypothetical protein